MVTWLDRFTGQVYHLSEKQHTAIRNTVARALAAEIRQHTTPQDQADAVATWLQTNYYECVFPLRFGREPQGTFSRGAFLEYTGTEGTPACPTRQNGARSFCRKDASLQSFQPKRSPTHSSRICFL